MSDNINFNNVIFGEGTLFKNPIKIISPLQGVEFGKYCAIAPNLKIIGTNHDYNFPAIQLTFYKKMFNISHPFDSNSNIITKGKIIIGNDVWIGEDVVILSGVKIGDGCCIGARSVVTKDLPPYSICVGQPCKPVKKRYNEDIIQFLLKIQWWNWDKEKIKKNKNFFMTNLNTISDVVELEKIIC
jgi:acetyltransferase-like isoleucine patch superfamily enzyme